jgi:hypothetical protein
VVYRSNLEEMVERYVDMGACAGAEFAIDLVHRIRETKEVKSWTSADEARDFDREIGPAEEGGWVYAFAR